MSAQRFSQQWRDDHARRGDELLAQADELLAQVDMPGPEHLTGLDQGRVLICGTLADMANAHYAAANVRARPFDPQAAQIASELGGRVVSIDPDPRLGQKSF